jgi:predicted DNA-binding transcriptional regulator AlpA
VVGGGANSRGGRPTGRFARVFGLTTYHWLSLTQLGVSLVSLRYDPTGHDKPITPARPARERRFAGEERMMLNNRADKMLTASQVCELTGVPVSTLHDWAAKRERGINAPGPHHVRLSSRHRRWTKDDVEQWIQSARM